MTDRLQTDLSRRSMLKTLAAAPLLLAVPSLLGLSACEAQPLTATQKCDDGENAVPTLTQAEGPYFTPNSPLRTSLLETGLGGTVLVLSGQVLTTSCATVPNTRLDFWQANDGGEYDMTGVRLRGHQFTDAKGNYRLETIVPGAYPGRTRHIHVKVQAPGGRVLTTQLYFPGEARNASDSQYHPALVINVASTGSTLNGTFNFVVDL